MSNLSRKTKRRVGRPRSENLFLAVLILKGFFTWGIGTPRWNFIANILQPYCTGQLTYKGFYGEKYSPLQNWWHTWKKIIWKKYRIEIDEVEYARIFMSIFDD